MGAMVRAQRQGLDMPISEGGANLSTGERQLLCLAAVLLTQAKVCSQLVPPRSSHVVAIVSIVCVSTILWQVSIPAAFLSS
jgi:hypothetical protein